MQTFETQKAAILLIDSDPQTLAGMTAMLEGAGYTCHGVRDSEAAMRGACSICPDLIICDVEIEGDSGLELCDELHLLAGLQDVPVVYLASRRMPDIVSRIHRAGGAYYLSKPLDPWVLLELVDKALWMPHLVRSHLDRQDAPAPIGGPKTRPSARSMSGRARPTRP